MKTSLGKHLFQSFDITKPISPHDNVFLYACPLGKHSSNSEEINILKNFLSEDELRLSQKYKYAHLKANAIMSRGILRLILADYLNIDNPQNIIFQTNQYSKPFIPHPPIHFSVSHCDSILTIAVNHLHPLGIDVENIHKVIDDDLADFTLSKQELYFYYLENPKLRPKLFLTYWTRKESYLKAIGTGLVDHLAKINTTTNYIVDNDTITPYRCYDVHIDSNHICTLSYANI